MRSGSVPPTLAIEGSEAAGSGWCGMAGDPNMCSPTYNAWQDGIGDVPTKASAAAAADM